MALDGERFRGMLQKVIPLHLYESQDIEFILGVRGDMDSEEIRTCLNSEYQKWNSRVTNSDAVVRQQVEAMLCLITSARQKFVEQTA